MQSNNALKTLNLAYNGFADDGIAALADTLKINSTLMELDIRYVNTYYAWHLPSMIFILMYL